MRDHHIICFHGKYGKLSLYLFIYSLFSTAPFSCLGRQQIYLCILVDPSTAICWMSPFVILGVSGLFFVTFILFLMENPVSKQ